MIVRIEMAGEPTHAELEALFRSRHISDACDQFHHDAEDAGCTNGLCECWCH